jgi:2-isopropylmalate synthase
MTRERLSLYDTTLRDGAQTHGVDFSVEDKWLIAEQLDALGHYIEAGYPAPAHRHQALRRSAPAS